MATSKVEIFEYYPVNALDCTSDEHCAICLDHFKEAHAAGTASATDTLADAPTIEEFVKFNSLDEYTASLVLEIAETRQCGHRFHRDCLLTWLSGRRTCPLCRYELRAEEDKAREDREAVEAALEAWHTAVMEEGNQTAPVTELRRGVGWWDADQMPTGYYDVQVTATAHQMNMGGAEPRRAEWEFETQGYEEEGNDRGYC